MFDPEYLVPIGRGGRCGLWSYEIADSAKEVCRPGYFARAPLGKGHWIYLHASRHARAEFQILCVTDFVDGAPVVTAATWLLKAKPVATAAEAAE